MASTPSEPPQIVNLWCHPRSCSTMFECMILGLPQFHVLHEHMAQYLIDLSKPNGSIAESLSSSHSTTPNNPTLVPTELLFPSSPSMNHTFLIRHPSKAVPSYARLCEGEASAITGFYGFDGKEMGYKELRKMFDFVREQTGKMPLLIESEELLKNPEAVMNMWCEEVGIKFEKEMLEWDDQKREHFDKWPGFHDDAKKSKGVGKQAANDGSSATLAKAPDASAKPALRPELQQAVEDCMDDYEYLKQFARKP
ncbi:hypothetical protein JCM5353_005163 [Sporobolomyces roseus]